MSSRALPALAVAATLTAACGGIDNAQHVDPMRAFLAKPPAWVDDGALGRRLWAIERAFYESRGYEPAWIDGDRTTPQWKDLVQQLKYAEWHGLDPERYAVASFEREREESQTRISGTRFAPDRVPALDARMTYAYLQYAADLLGWTGSPRSIDRNWRVAAKKDDLAARLARAVADGSVRDTLEDLAPTHPQYRGLQAALVRGAGLADEGLADEGLAHEGGRGEENADRIRMNLERWRWAPRDLGERYILINVPRYQLQVMEGETPALAMRVIVGKPDSPTPIFSDEMTYVVFSPYWNIPESILREETLPRLAGDPEYLERNNIEVVSGDEVVDASNIDWSDEAETAGLRFRQGPGPENALGLIKFIFPNHFSVYLHDTPSDRLFFRDERALSHGCIRVEDPVGLARYVLRDQPRWTEAAIRGAMNAEREQTARLKSPLPVHIGYWTAWVEPDGSVTFSDDPYGIDARQARRR